MDGIRQKPCVPICFARVAHRHILHPRRLHEAQRWFARSGSEIPHPRRAFDWFPRLRHRLDLWCYGFSRSCSNHLGSWLRGHSRHTAAVRSCTRDHCTRLQGRCCPDAFLDSGCLSRCPHPDHSLPVDRFKGRRIHGADQLSRPVFAYPLCGENFLCLGDPRLHNADHRELRRDSTKQLQAPTRLFIDRQCRLHPARHRCQSHGRRRSFIRENRRILPRQLPDHDDGRIFHPQHHPCAKWQR